MWLDFGCSIVLLGLFFYVLAFSSITVLHKIYGVVHFIFLLWPFFQFLAQTADDARFALLFLSTAYVALSLLGACWLVFTIFLTGQSYVLRKLRLFMLMTPAMISAGIILFNPAGMFIDIRLTEGLDPLSQLNNGPLFWIMFAELILYFSISFAIMLHTLRKDASARHKRLVKTGMNGIIMLILFGIADMLLNILFKPYSTYYFPLMSIGFSLSGMYLVHAIARHKVFDIIQLVQRDVMNTMSTGIIVLDEDDTILEVNRVLRPMLRLRVGDPLHPNMITSQLNAASASEFEQFLIAMRRHPLERMELEMTFHLDKYRHVIMQYAPIMSNKKALLGRVLTFQDVTEFRMLVEETNIQNEMLQERNQELIVMQDELHEANRKLEHMAITDSLTGCYNRRFLLQQLEHEVIINLQYGVPFSIFLFDIDLFKGINDTYGHLVGDEVLCSTVEAVRGTLRLTDLLARYGGEEFTVYLPHTSKDQAELVAEHVKEAVEQNVVSTGIGNQKVSVTISMGVLCIEEQDRRRIDNPKAYLRELLAEADAALYEAKFQGRNRIVKRKLA